MFARYIASESQNVIVVNFDDSSHQNYYKLYFGSQLQDISFQNQFKSVQNNNRNSFQSFQIPDYCLSIYFDIQA